MVEIKEKEEYEAFLNGLTEESRARRLEKILDIRKFEIELYWKRATYFWAFIGVSFAAYGLTIGKPGDGKFQFLIICIGLLFSLAFYMVNKASKFWQENWEAHTDWNESKIIGPLYKITLPKSKRKDLWNPALRYSASVSRINIYISFVLVIFWLSLLICFCVERAENIKFTYVFKSKGLYYYAILLLFTCWSCYYLLFRTTSELEETDDEEVKFIMRD